MSAGKEGQPINDFKFDIDLFLQCAKEYGAVIRECKPGQGGIFIQGKRVTGKDIFSMKDCYCSGKCDRCIWKRNGGCSEWNGTRRNLNTMGEQKTQCELYAIPENGGQPVKINGIAALSEIRFGDNSYENEQFAWRDMQAVSCSVTMTNGYARILNRFARRTRRYLRRHEQQAKRQSAKERKRNNNQTELLS